MVSELDRLHADRKWEEFAELFLQLYHSTDEIGKLKLIRRLLTEWRRTEILDKVTQWL